MTDRPVKYPLLPFSQLVYDITRWMPGVYRFPITLRWKDGAKEKDRIEQAVRLAMMNHPVFSMRVDWRGMHSASKLKDILHGKYMDVAIYTKGNDLYIDISGSRILGDGRSAEIWLEDIERAYKGLPLEPDDYWGYVARYEQHKSEPHYSISQAWLMREFADESVPVRPTIDRRWIMTLLPPKAGAYTNDYTALHEQIERLKEERFISYEGIFSLCVALAIADYCGTDEAALTWAYEGRETPEEQRVFGSLHRDVPFRVSRKSKVESQKPASREELIKEARNQIRQGIAHSDYPYTLTKPYASRWNYAVNVLRSADPEDMVQGMSLPLTVESVPEQKYAYALLDVEIHEKGPRLALVYRYSATHYKEKSIRRFARLVRKYVEGIAKSEERRVKSEEIIVNSELRGLLKQSLRQAAEANPHRETNPVRTIEDWCAYVERFAHQMPWQTMDIGEDASFFRRIDQNIGYFYFLIDQPLEALEDKGYIYPSLQYEPRFAQWLKEYNIAWGGWLSSLESWNDDYYQLALSDPLFELASDRYESPSNWHSWNDFFARRLKRNLQSSISNLQSKFVAPCDGEIAFSPVKTATIATWLDLLGDSSYREVFAGGETIHIVLDVFDYHRFHMPCDGTVLECKTIQGIHAGGGVIIWDEEQGRYRYLQCGVTDFQMLETRGVLVVDTPAFGKIAIVPVGVQQASSVQWTFYNQQSPITNHQLSQGDELGKFLFGGSDVVLFFEPGRAPHISAKNVKVGDPLIENH